MPLSFDVCIANTHLLYIVLQLNFLRKVIFSCIRVNSLCYFKFRKYRSQGFIHEKLYSSSAIYFFAGGLVPRPLCRRTERLHYSRTHVAQMCSRSLLKDEDGVFPAKP